MALLYCWSGAAGSGSGADWTNAKTNLTAAFITEVAGDTIFVAHDHAESTAAGIVLTSSGTVANPTKIICVNRSGTVPPVSADRRATATVTTTGAATSSITIAGYAHYDGIIFSAGTGGSAPQTILANTGNVWQRFDNCSMRNGVAGTLAGALQIGTPSVGSTYVEFNNTTVSFAAVGQSIRSYGFFRWRNTPSALLGTIPTALFSPGSSAFGGSAECIGVDLSAAGSGKTIVDTGTVQAQSYRFIDCKLDAAVTKSTVPAAVGSPEVDFIRSGSSGINYAVYRHRSTGALTEETTIVRTGGANDGTTPLAWKIVTTANCTYSMPFECPAVAIWNDTTGSAVTATVEGITATLPTDQEVWVDVEYLGDASSPQGSFVNDGKADLIATAANQTSSSETWGGSTAKFKLGVTFTAQQKGWIYARVKIGKASSTIYIDPLITLT